MQRKGMYLYNWLMKYQPSYATCLNDWKYMEKAEDDLRAGKKIELYGLVLWMVNGKIKGKEYNLE